MLKSPAASLASLTEAERAAFLDELSPNALAAMPWLWELWAHPGHQIEPAGDWKCWVIVGGRGAGKTRAGAEWVRAQMEGAGPLDDGRCRRVALVGETIDEVRAVMVEGDSGILAVSPPDRRPIFKVSQSKLVWPNGAEAQMYSSANPEALRGPQFDAAWSDELGKWRRCRDTWQMLQFCLRLGERPRQIVTTTPRGDNPLLLELVEARGSVVTRAPTAANRAYLAEGFIEQVSATFGGTSLARQELAGEFVTERPGALWTRAVIEAGRVRQAPEFARVVVAVDPPVTAGEQSDECGVVVAGLAVDEGGGRQVYVLADESIGGVSPSAWADRALAAYRAFNADRLIAEVNQGGISWRRSFGTRTPL